jgi:hypothetical protein
MRELSDADEIERHGLLPGGFGRIDRNRRLTTTRRIHEDVDCSERVASGLRKRLRRAFRHHVYFDDLGLEPAGGNDLVRERLEEITATRSHRELHAFGGKPLCNRASDAHARAGHQRGFAFEL